MLKYILIFSFIITASLNAESDKEKGSLRGLVTDSLSGEAVLYANVSIRGTSFGSPTNNKGYYFIPSIPEGKYQIIFSHLNYRTKEILVDIKAGQINELDVHLSGTEYQMGDVSVIGEKVVRPTETDLGLEKISAREIEMVPVGFEADIFKVIQSTSGVSSTGDVTAQYYVRGGGGDQNLVLLNGATVYNPFHAMGIFSVIDPEMISGMEFYKGGFSADLGGRLSSIINVITKDGNKNSFHGSAQASFISGKVSVEGPIPYGSFIATGRKSYLTSQLKRYLHKEVPFDFYDASLKINYSNPGFDKGSKFVFYGFISNDAVINESPFVEDFVVNNNIAGMNWHKVWGSPLYSVLNLSYSGYDADLFPELSKSRPRYNEIKDITADLNFTYMYDSRDELMFGLQNKFIRTKIRMENLRDKKIDYMQKGLDMNVYGNYKFYRWEKFGLEIGLRMKFIALTEYRPFLFEPRIALNYRPNALYSFKFSVGRYSQELSSIMNENEIISIFQPWLLTPEKTQSPEATQISAGAAVYITEYLTIESEIYYKYLTNLFDINERKYSDRFPDYINVDGEAYGLEMLMRYQRAPFFIKSSYSLSWAFRILNNVKYVPRYDIRHSGNILVGVDLGKGWETSITWAIKSGMPFTPIAGFYDRPPINDPWQMMYLFRTFDAAPYWGERNSQRLPFYHRLDLSLSKKFNFDIAEMSIGVSIINLYDRKNIYYFNRDTGESIYMLPFLPSFYIQAAI